MCPPAIVGSGRPARRGRASLCARDRPHPLRVPLNVLVISVALARDALGDRGALQCASAALLLASAAPATIWAKSRKGKLEADVPRPWRLVGTVVRAKAIEKSRTHGPCGVGLAQPALRLGRSRTSDRPRNARTPVPRVVVCRRWHTARAYLGARTSAAHTPLSGLINGCKCAAVAGGGVRGGRRGKEVTPHGRPPSRTYMIIYT
eukprot:scaffold32625_cov112-Isochrysis_galbana.AAC.3